jgi:hypothetical protein
MDENGTCNTEFIKQKFPVLTRPGTFNVRVEFSSSEVFHRRPLNRSLRDIPACGATSLSSPPSPLLLQKLNDELVLPAIPPLSLVISPFPRAKGRRTNGACILNPRRAYPRTRSLRMSGISAKLLSTSARRKCEKSYGSSIHASSKSMIVSWNRLAARTSVTRTMTTVRVMLSSSVDHPISGLSAEDMAMHRSVGGSSWRVHLC